MICQQSSEFPFVSVIVPAKNEQEHIEECLESLLVQNYPLDRYEIIVIDDHSSDQTANIVMDFAKDHGNVRAHKNDGFGTADARNTGIERASGEVLVNFSGHAVAGVDFLHTLVSKLQKQEDKVAGVGCKHETPRSDTFTAKAIGFVMSNPFAGFGTSYKESNKEGFKESIAFTAYRRSVFEQIGKFDSELSDGDDAELNLRIRKAGLKLLYTPETIVYHHKKGSFRAFFIRMFKYGAARTAITKKHPDVLGIASLVPALMIASLSVLVVLSFIRSVFFYAFVSILLLYLTCNMISSIRISVKHGTTYFPTVFALFPLLHLGYGLGFLYGLFR